MPAILQTTLGQRAGGATLDGAQRDHIENRRSARRAVKRLVSTAAAVLLAAIAFLSGAMAITSRLSADGQPGLLGHPVMIVLSGSMAPVINTGDLVVAGGLNRSQAADLRAGDIVSFRASAGSSRIFTHRILAVDTLPGGGVAYVTKGDANDSRDEPLVPSSDVVGLYQWRVPYAGYLLNALHRPLVFGLLLASALLWLVSEPLWKWAHAADAGTETGEPSD